MLQPAEKRPALHLAPGSAPPRKRSRAMKAAAGRGDEGGPGEVADRAELVRLIGKSLAELGFAAAAAAVERESGVACQALEVDALCRAVSDGQWDAVCGLLPHLRLGSPAKLRQGAVPAPGAEVLGGSQRPVDNAPPPARGRPSRLWLHPPTPVLHRGGGAS